MKELKASSILMISFDTGLLQVNGSGDAIYRHIEYAKSIKRLDIIVLGKSDSKINVLSDNCQAYGVGNNLLSMFKAFILAGKLIKQNHYDLIDAQDPHLTGLLGVLLKKKYKIKLELHDHGDFWDDPEWVALAFKNRFLEILQKIIIKNADAVRVVNRKIKEKLIKHGITENIIETINTPINTDTFTKNVDQNKIDNIRNTYKNKKIIIFVGRLVSQKNLPFTLEVIKNLKTKRDDFVLLLIGDGNEHDKLSNFIKTDELEDTVFLLGTKSHEELLAYYQAAYLLILLSSTESFGKVIIEAGLAATPTLAAKAIGPLIIIEDDKNGWLVDINDLSGTVNKLSTLLDDAKLVQAVGQKIKEDFIRDYGRPQTFKKVNNFWFKIINNQL